MTNKVPGRDASRTAAPARASAAATPARPAASATPATPKPPADGLVEKKRKVLSLVGARAVAGVAPGAIDPGLVAFAQAALKGALATMPMQQKSVAAAGVALNRNPGTAPLATGTGPITNEQWKNPLLLVGAMTQNGVGADAISGSARCGPTNLLATALLQGGPAAAAKLLEKTAASAGPYLERGDARELKALAEKVKKQTATFEDLSKAQGLMYSAANRETWFGEALTQAKQDGGLEGAQVARLETLAGKAPGLSAADKRELGELLSLGLDRDVTVDVVTAKGFEDRGPQVVVKFKDGFQLDTHGLADGELAAAAKHGGFKSTQVVAHGDAGAAATGALKTLKPGESAVLRVGLDGSSSNPDHYVTVGRLTDGRPFVYNPDPSRGDATLVVGSPKDPQPATFTAELAKYDGRSIGQKTTGGAMDLGVVPPMTKVKL